MALNGIFKIIHMPLLRHDQQCKHTSHRSVAACSTESYLRMTLHKSLLLSLAANLDGMNPPIIKYY